MTDVELRSITARFGASTVLHDLDLTVAAGTRHAVIGPNGAGKTTLLNIIAGTLRPSAGRILLAGRDVTRLGPHRRAQLGIARTWQHPALCGRLTALQNVLLAIHDGHAASRRRAALDLLDSEGLADKATVPAARLSYGQQRRLELAVALAARPRLLLLDEPSAGLTTADTGQLAQRLLALDRAITLILVEHNLDLVNAVADSTTRLAGSRIDSSNEATHPTARHQDRDRRIENSPEPSGRTYTPLLAVRDLAATYHGQPILKEVSFDLMPGQIFAVTGANGSGKSTLLHSVAGLHRTHPGTRIDLDGLSLAGLSAAQRNRRGISLLPQQRRLFHDLSVDDNLRLSGMRTSDHQPWTLAELRDWFPTLHHLRAQPAGRLSGGEQQLAALARTLLTQPRLLMLDEPFESLATEHSHQLEDLVCEAAARGLGILIADYEQRRLRTLADAVLVLGGAATSSDA
jgi:ABC-type branched-subunit amino acid transport system ATPase component